VAGTKNDVLVGKNADFSQATGPNSTTSENNGLVLNGQLWIGTTVANVGGTHITVGHITSTGGTINVSNNAGNINIDLPGGRQSIQTLTGNSGGAISPTANNINTLGTGSITIAGAGSTLTTQLTGLTNHAVLVGAGTATITNVGPTATAGQVLQSAGAAADPAFSTATYPLTTTINQILFSSATNTVTGLATANSAVLVTGSTGVPVFSGTMTNGQLIIGSTGATPTAAVLTAGAGITITNGAGSITIAASTSGFTWHDEAISYSALAENGYMSTAVVTGSLPAAGAPNGTTILFVASTTDLHTISPATTDVIQLGSSVSTNGTGSGKIVSTKKGDTVELVYQSSSGIWFSRNVIGNWTVV
jgi:hypothetical protein